MRQAQETRPIDLAPAKRGRGRPRVENPLSAAERAKRYRERKRQAGASANGRAGADSSPAVRDAKDAQLQRLKAELQAQREAAARHERERAQMGREIADLRGLLDMFIEARMKRKTIPADVFRNICASYLKK